jgi:hypothetical protein
MLSFSNHAVPAETILSNSAKLARFTPDGLTNNALTIVNGDHIEVISRETSVEALSSDLDKLSLKQERKDSFVQEKKILLWHFSKLLPYLTERLAQLRSMPVESLHQYHDNSMQLQGFYQLCRNLVLQLQTLNQLMTRLENPRKQYWSFEFNLLQASLSQDLARTVASAQNFLTQIADQRKEKLTVTAPRMLRVGPFVLVAPIAPPIPLKFTLSRLKIANQHYKAKAHLQTFRNTWEMPTRFQFTGKLCIDVFQGETALCPTLDAYPSWDWDLKALTEKPKSKVDFPEDSAHNKLKAQYSKNPVGSIRFEPVVLRASFSHECQHASSGQVLPYFVTLINIAKSHKINDITVYAPYNYSAIMYACGLYVPYTDLQNPTLEEQGRIVEHSQVVGVEVPVMNERVNRYTTAEKKDPLLRPFCMDLSRLESRPVYLTDSNVVTTYAKLLTESTIVDKAHPEGVFPEVLQIPLQFKAPYSSLRSREIAGKLTRPAICYGMQDVDYEALDRNDELQDFAFAAPSASPQGPSQKMLTLKRKMI